MSNWNMRHWVTASMAAIGTVATFKIMLEYRNWRRDSRQKKARRAERKRRREDPNRLAQKGLPTDAQLREATFMSIQNAVMVSLLSLPLRDYSMSLPPFYFLAPSL